MRWIIADQHSVERKAADPTKARTRLSHTLPPQSPTMKSEPMNGRRSSLQVLFRGIHWSEHSGCRSMHCKSRVQMPYKYWRGLGAWSNSQKGWGLQHNRETWRSGVNFTETMGTSQRIASSWGTKWYHYWREVTFLNTSQTKGNNFVQ